MPEIVKLEILSEKDKQYKMVYFDDGSVEITIYQKRVKGYEVWYEPVLKYEVDYVSSDDE